MKNIFLLLQCCFTQRRHQPETELNFNLINLNATAATEVANDQVSSVIQVMLNGNGIQRP